MKNLWARDKTLAAVSSLASFMTWGKSFNLFSHIYLNGKTRAQTKFLISDKSE